jgi:hypothetical protein
MLHFSDVPFPHFVVPVSQQVAQAAEVAALKVVAPVAAQAAVVQVAVVLAAEYTALVVRLDY